MTIQGWQCISHSLLSQPVHPPAALVASSDFEKGACGVLGELGSKGVARRRRVPTVRSLASTFSERAPKDLSQQCELDLPFTNFEGSVAELMPCLAHQPATLKTVINIYYRLGCRPVFSNTRRLHHDIGAPSPIPDDIYLPFDSSALTEKQSGHEPLNRHTPSHVKRIAGAHILAQDKSSVTEGSTDEHLQRSGNLNPSNSISKPTVKNFSSQVNQGGDPPMLLGSSSIPTQPALKIGKPPDLSRSCKDRTSAQSPVTIGKRNVVQRRKSASIGVLQPSRIAPLSRRHRQPSAINRETWQTQKDALAAKFGPAGWSPRKRLSPDALEGIRTLHKQFPGKYSSPVLANHFEVSVEAIRRILKSKWRPNDDETADRRQRWDKRGERIWSQMVSLGVKPPKKWREVSSGFPLSFAPRINRSQASGIFACLVCQCPTAMVT